MTVLKVIREADDPLALRASVGGGKAAGDGRYYLVFRGDPIDVLEMLRAVVSAAEDELPKQARPTG